MRLCKPISACWLVLLYLSYDAALADDPKPKPFEFKDGDRIVFLGSTWIEREQLWGYWETALTTLFPDKKITFRNLGRSGDTVWGDAWAGFDTAMEGYQRRLKLVKEQRPTVIFFGFGWNESFAGSSKIADYKKKYNSLLTDLSGPEVRFVLLSPFQIGADDWPYGKLKERQDQLKVYGAAGKELAKERGAYFLDDVYLQYGPLKSALADGLPTELFYARTVPGLKRELHLDAAKTFSPIVFDGPGKITLTQKRLFHAHDSADLMVTAKELAPGKYTLKIDGQVVRTVSDTEVRTISVPDPSLRQAEELRQTIIEKNQLFFHRSRPQNETYLFGFRKYEQGQNAKEVPQFDPLIEALEKKIDDLKKPKPHTYELVRIGD